MIGKISILLSITLVLCFSAKVKANVDVDKGSVDGLKGTDYLMDITRINRNLVERESSKDAMTNLKLVDTLYGEYLRERPRPVNKLAAARLFLKLGSVLEPGMKCTQASYNVLIQNQLSTRHNGYRKVSGKECLRRVESVLQQVALEHSNQCLSTHLSNYKAKVSSFSDKDSLDKVRNIFANVYPATDSRVAYDFIVRMYAENPYTRSDVLNEEFFYNKLKELTSTNESGRFLHPVENEIKGEVEANPYELKRLYREYFGEPCDRYVSEMADVMEPLALDASWHHEALDGELELYKDWTGYVLCKKVEAKERENVESLTDYVNRLD